MEQLLTEEEVYWKQRGKIHWLWEGDGNTSFFHNKISTRRRTNAITRIKNGEGQWLDRTEDIWNHIETYFRDIFRSRSPSEDELEKGLRQSRRVLPIKCCRRSHSRYTAEDILSTLSQMAPLKSPGLDGMPPFFFQKYWHIVRYDVVSSTISLLNDLIMPPELNHTHIALILKCKKPESLSQFRPIASATLPKINFQDNHK
ncbi:UNVERIFIED_CONTAM: hypothetical protein Scaly_0692900 [Sesamum calycinum]|uniref:Reverse transcriptase n=1 Tax=Sesamum calycinum TaxID=2727403 RepID=A0AAW2R8F9_9LAMI